jgi:FkbM family methyltransferase
MSVFTEKQSGFKFTMDDTSAAAQAIIRSGFSTHGLIEWCRQYLSSDSTFIDVGAHIGSYSLILSSQCRTVHAFEPAATTRAWLQAAIETNAITNVHVYEAALGAQEGTADLYHCSPDGLRTSLRKVLGVTDVEEVSVKTLDSYSFTDVSFIKISVNGTELDVLRGATSTLEQHHYPRILVETRDNAVQTCLRELGYKVFPVTGCEGMYLASDHPQHPQKAKKDPVSKEPTEFADYLELARLHRNKRMYLQAYHSAHRGLALTQYPRHKIQMQYELAIAAFYVGEVAESLEVANKVLVSFLTDWETRNGILHLIGRSLRPLPVKRRVRLEPPLETGYCPSSTSIIPHGTGFRACVRTVNYVLDDVGGYTIHDTQGRVQTTNYIMEFDRDWRPTASMKLVDHSGVRLYSQNILGLEDVRIFGTNQFLAVYPEVNAERLPQVCYGEYDASGAVTKLLPLTVTQKLQCEKNWLPLVRGNEVLFIYNIGPFQLYRLNTDTGAVKVLKHQALCDENINDFRGSAPPIPYKDGWLAAIHQVYHDNPRNYFHRLVWFDFDFTTIKYSDLFYFQDVDIEYTLALCHSEEGLLIPYSFRDSSAVIAVLEYAEVDRMLKLA